MYKLLFSLCLILTACSSSISKISNQPIYILYDYEVKDQIIIQGQDTEDIVLGNYQKTLSEKLTKSFKKYKRNIVIKKGPIPEEGTTVIIGTIRPKLVLEKGKATCSIWYYCRVLHNKKRVNEISKIVSQDLIGDKLNEAEVMALIAFTHDQMVDPMSKRVIKADLK